MKWLASISTAICLAGCVRQNLDQRISEASSIEGSKYAAEVAAQSPFETKKLDLNDAEKLLASRNPKFVAAQKTLNKASENTPEVAQITNQLKTAVSNSVGGAISPSAILKSLQNPTSGIPKQIASVGKLKDVHKQIEQNAWQDTAATVDAELTMRRERIKLHRLFREGELIDTEIKILEASSKSMPKDDLKFAAAFSNWKSHLQTERNAWLTELRNLFDAEYHDVKFTSGRTFFPDYRNAEQPDLSDWKRWCKLQRTQELVSALSKQSSGRTSKIPGSILITSTLGRMVDDEPEKTTKLRDSGAIRREVRNVIQSWRELKHAQNQAALLESKNPTVANLEDISNRQKYFKFCDTEILHASILWELDEDCWK